MIETTRDKFARELMERADKLLTEALDIRGLVALTQIIESRLFEISQSVVMMEDVVLATKARGAHEELGSFLRDVIGVIELKRGESEEKEGEANG